MNINNNNIDRDHKKLPPPDYDIPKIVIPTAQHDNLKLLTEKHNDEN